MGGDWFKDWFADEHYQALYRHRNSAEASQALDLIEKSTGVSKDAAILDLACGAGRHSINLAKRGYSNITGLDLSVTLISEAKKNAEAEGVSVNFIQQDMRQFGGSYDLIMNLFTSFGYFATEAENYSVIERVATCLKADGYFILDFLNASMLCEGVQGRDEKLLPSGERVEQVREIRHGRIEKQIIIHSNEGDKQFRESVRLYELPEFESMFERAGLMIVKYFGDYSGGAFDAGSSPRLFLVAKKDV